MKRIVSLGALILILIPFSEDDINNEPCLSPEGKSLFFSRAGDICWVSAEVIKEMKPRGSAA